MPMIINRPPNGSPKPPHQVPTQPAVAMGDTVFATVFGLMAGLLALGSFGAAIWILSPAVTQNAGMGALMIPIISGLLMIVFIVGLFCAIKLTPLMLRGESSGFTLASVACFGLVASPVGAYALTSYIAMALAIGVLVLGFLGLYRGIHGRW